MRIIVAGAVSGQGTQLVNLQQHVIQLHVGLACLKRRIFTVPRVTDLFIVNWSKKQFRIFSEDKYSQSVTLQQCQCMHLLCSAVFSALFVCALEVL